MQTGWLQDNGDWYYLNLSGVMSANTTIGIYDFNSSGACINPYGNSSKAPSEIQPILKNDYGFIDYNDGLLLTPYGKDYASHGGGYVNNQIVIMHMYDNSAVTMWIMKDDAETARIFKVILNMVIPNYADESFATMTDFINSWKTDTTFYLGEKTIKLARGADNNYKVC